MEGGKQVSEGAGGGRRGWLTLRREERQRRPLRRDLGDVSKEQASVWGRRRPGGRKGRCRGPAEVVSARSGNSEVTVSSGASGVQWGRRGDW